MGDAAAARCRAVRVAAVPNGRPQPEDLDVADVPTPQPGSGEVLVRARYLSIDPYVLNRIRAGAAGFRIGEVVSGRVAGEVVVPAGDLKVGDLVVGDAAWSEYAVAPPQALRRVGEDVFPLRSHLGIAGIPGLTAYVGMASIGRPEAGARVFVSAAAGAVGSLACQIARLNGARVAGCAGSPAKVAWLREVAGIDAAFDYRTGPDLGRAVGDVCPEGIDLAFECVGGAQLEAVIANMRRDGRIVVCGLIDPAGSGAADSGPRNFDQIIGRRLVMQGFVVGDHLSRLPEFHAALAGWVADGRVAWQETVREGIGAVPTAFAGLFAGDNLGKMLVRVAGAGPSA